MVKYTIQTSKQLIVGFQVTGHADYPKSGDDIVCAGVSAIAQTIALGLVKQLGPDTMWQQKKGKLSCRIGKLSTDEELIVSQAILKSMQLGIEALQEAYPDFIKVEYKEV
ncbi:MAG: ribosomal-processing cysteine protease Prp [Methylocystaceae bacterium]